MWLSIIVIGCFVVTSFIRRTVIDQSITYVIPHGQVLEVVEDGVILPDIGHEAVGLQ